MAVVQLKSVRGDSSVEDCIVKEPGYSLTESNENVAHFDCGDVIGQVIYLFADGS